jgi:mediator of RNA polymerase II transcription subunit 16
VLVPLDLVSLANPSGGQYSAVIAALSIAMSAAAIQTTNYDDILAMARPFAVEHESMFCFTSVP